MATKVLILMPSMRGGGAERVLINILEGIDQDEFSVELIALENKGELWNEIPNYVSKRCIGFPILFRKVGIVLYRRFGLQLLIRLLAKKIKGEYDTGIVFLDSVYSMCLHLSSARFRKKFLVVHSSYSSYNQRSRFIQGNHYNRMKERYALSDGIILVAKEALEEFRRLFGFYEKTCCIYNPINNPKVLLKAKETLATKTEDQFVFIAIGGLMPVKDFSLLIEASRILNERCENFIVNILGKGELEEKLKSEIKRAKLGNRVFLKGFQANPYNWLKNSDCFVMSSKSEGLPTVLCESMLLGIPSIVPDITGCREVSENGKYAAQYKRDPRHLSELMERMMKDKTYYTHYAAMAGRRAKIFDHQQALESYESLFEGNFNKACIETR